MNALNLEQLEKVYGGYLEGLEHEDDCDHPSFISLGKSKEENGVQYLYVQCKCCRENMWVKLTDLFAPATEVSPTAPAK